MHAHLLQDIGICIVAATILAYAARAARQPLVLAYVAAGVLTGPAGLGLITDPASIQSLAELGLAFLLFIVGLEIDLKKITAPGAAAAVTTAVQVAGCGLLGAWVGRWLGFSVLSAAYLGAAVAFSSTLIVVKLLSDASELDTVAGRATLAILLFQDVVAIAALAIQPELGAAGEGASPMGSLGISMGLSVVKGLALAAGALLTSRFVLPALFRWVAKSPEILLISAVSWCFLVCYAAMAAGFSSAMGALIAGVSISTLPYSLDVVAKIRSLRDFFVTLFFVSLGLLLAIPSGKLLLAAVALAAAALAGRLLTVFPLLRLFRYGNRVSLLSTLHLSQTGEFGLVIVLIGASDRYRHIGSDLVSLVVLILVITATLSAYLIHFSHGIAAVLLRRVSGTSLEDSQSRGGRGRSSDAPPIVLVGCFRIASSLVHPLLESGRLFKVIDFNPRVHQELKKLGVPCVYGDISHPDTLEDAGIEKARVLVSSIPDDFLRGTSNRKLLDALRRLNPEARILLTAETVPHALELYEAGADYVLLPRLLGADRLLEVLEGAEKDSLGEVREREIARLRERKQVVL